MLFKRKKYEPLDYERRKYFENNFAWLCDMFPEMDLIKLKIFKPIYDDFPIKWNGSEDNVVNVTKIICKSMQIDFEEIELQYYREGLEELPAGMNPIILQNENKKTFAGFFNKKNENGKYIVFVNEINLQKPEVLITTIAYELAYIRLLNLNVDSDIDGYLSDFSTVFFGFGIFAANSSFHFFQSNEKWGYSSTGYFYYDEWAYALALLAFIRDEDKNPEWSLFLNKTVKKEFDKCLKYLIENEENIFK